jgi:hypothetical protein
MAGRPIRRDGPVNRGEPLPIRRDRDPIDGFRAIRGDAYFGMKAYRASNNKEF